MAGFSTEKLVSYWVVVLTSINRKISDWLFKLQPEKSAEREAGDFIALTPTLLNRKEILEYERQLNNALQGKTCKKITNIAITGSYAVGKSSFLRTFIHHNPVYRNTPIISMAKFGLNEQDGAEVTVKPNGANGVLGEKPVESDAAQAENRQYFHEQVEIEKSILEQLLYTVKPEKLILSRFRRKRELSKFLIFSLVLLAISFLMLIPTVWVEVVLAFPDWVQLSRIPVSVAYFYIFAFFIFLLPKLLNAVKSYSITKFSIQGVDFERQNSGSFLRENIDEFIYYFDQTDIKLVIFEDIDRLDAAQALNILTHIREVNRIVNLGRCVPVFFIYAVRDDLFNAEDRAKFFDLIIPIIPVINSNNSFEKMISALASDSSIDADKNAISEDLVRGVSLFFGDLRLVFNLVNEYKIYKTMLTKNNHLNLNKLFAMLAVKVLYPSVYSSLVLNKGPIYNVVASVNSVASSLCDDIKAEIELISMRIENKKELISGSKSDLLVSFWLCCFKKNGVSTFPYKINFQGNMYEIPSVFEPGSVFERFILGEIKEDLSVYDYRNSQVGYFRHSTKVVNGSGLTYDKCISLLASNSTADLKRISELKENLKDIEDYRIKDLVNIQSTRKALFKNLSEEHGLIRFLITHGYIGEDYADYTSFFYPGTLTQADKIKVQKIKEFEKLPTDTVFDKPSAVLEQLQKADLLAGRGLILGLIPELLKNKNKDKLRSTLLQSSRYSAEIIDLWEGLENTDERIDFLAALVKHDFESAMSALVLLNDNGKYGQYSLSLYISDLLEIDSRAISGSRIRSSAAFIDVVSGLKELYCLDDVQNTWFWSESGICYYQLESASEDSLSKIRFYNQFEINITMLRTLLSGVSNCKEGCSEISYCSVIRAGCVEFLNYINENINSFISVVVEMDCWKESHESALKIYENESLSDEYKICVAKSTGGVFNFSEVPHGLLAEFMRNELLAPSWDAVLNTWSASDESPLNYEFEYDLDKTIINFVVKFIDDLKLSKCEKLSDEFIIYILGLDFSEEDFSELVHCLALNYKIIDSLVLSNKRWELLVDLSSLDFSEESFLIIQSNSHVAAVKMLLSDWPARYDKLVDKSEISQEVVLGILNSNQLELSEKLELYDENRDIYFTNHQALADKLVSEALASNLNLPPISSSLVTQMFSSDQLELRIKLVLYYISNSSKDFNSICNYLSSFKIAGLTGLSKVPRKVTVDRSEGMVDLLYKLKELTFVGEIKDFGLGKLTAYTKPTNCV